MIEKIETEHNSDDTKGCIIIGSPSIGKTHFSIYLAFYLTRRYPSSDFVYEQPFRNESKVYYVKSNKCIMQIDLKSGSSLPNDIFYIVDSVIPAPLVTRFTYLIITPKNERWKKFYNKDGIVKYYVPIWSEKEIWSVWKNNSKYLTRIPEDSLLLDGASDLSFLDIFWIFDRIFSKDLIVSCSLGYFFGSLFDSLDYLIYYI
jgi:hypothetical protein